MLQPLARTNWGRSKFFCVWNISVPHLGAYGKPSEMLWKRSLTHFVCWSRACSFRKNKATPASSHFPLCPLTFHFPKIKEEKNQGLNSLMFLNTSQQQKETKWNNPLNYYIFKKNHNLVVRVVCARPSLASQAIFSPSSCCVWCLAVLKEVTCCLPQASSQSTESQSPLTLSAQFFKSQQPSLQTSDCSATTSVEETCQIFLHHHQLFFFFFCEQYNDLIPCLPIKKTTGNQCRCRHAPSRCL